jgi:hypothetical protein
MACTMRRPRKGVLKAMLAVLCSGDEAAIAGRATLPSLVFPTLPLGVGIFGS